MNKLLLGILAVIIFSIASNNVNATCNQEFADNLLCGAGNKDFIQVNPGPNSYNFSSSGYWGIKVLNQYNSTLYRVNVSVCGLSPVTNVSLFSNTGVELANVALSGNVATLNYSIIENTMYYIVAHRGQFTAATYCSNPSVSFPVNLSTMQVLTGNGILIGTATSEFVQVESIEVIDTIAPKGGYSFAQNYFYINYTIPEGATNQSLWRLNYGSNLSDQYTTIPNDCFDAFPELRLRMYSSTQPAQSYGQCLNISGTWKTITTISNSGIFQGQGGVIENTSRLIDGIYNPNFPSFSYACCLESNIPGTCTWTSNSYCHDISFSRAAGIREESMVWYNPTHTIIFPYANNAYTTNRTLTYGISTDDPTYQNTTFHLFAYSGYIIDRCEQEFSNVSTSCGGLSTGRYSYNLLQGSSSGPELAIDGNYSTVYITAPGSNYSLYINYTRPIDATSDSIWRSKNTKLWAGTCAGSCVPIDTTINSVLYSGCWNSTIQILVNTSNLIAGASRGNNLQSYCWNYDNSTWYSISAASIPCGQTDCNGSVDRWQYVGLYEESMIWNIPKISVNTTTTNKTYSNTFPDGKFYYALTITNTTSSTYYDPNITIDTTPPNITFGGSTPANNTLLSATNILSITTNINETNLNYSVINIYNDTALINQTTYGNTTNNTLAYPITNNGIYYINATAYDLVGLSNSTETRLINITAIKSNLTLNAYTVANTTIPYNITLQSSGGNLTFTNNGSDRLTTFYGFGAIVNITVTSPSYNGCSYNNLTIYDNLLLSDCELYQRRTNITVYNSYNGSLISDYSLNYTTNSYTKSATANGTNLIIDLLELDYNLTFSHPEYLTKTTAFNPLDQLYTLEPFSISGSVTAGVACPTYFVAANYTNFNNIVQYGNLSCTASSGGFGAMEIYLGFSNGQRVFQGGYYNCDPSPGDNVINFASTNTSINVSYIEILGCKTATASQYNLFITGSVTYRNYTDSLPQIQPYNTTLNQSLITLTFHHAFDNSPIVNTNITVTDLTNNQTFNTSTGTLTFNPSSGPHNLSISASRYSTLIYPINVTGQQITTYNIGLLPILNISIYDEKQSMLTLTYFNFSNPQFMRWTAYCVDNEDNDIGTQQGIIPNSTIGAYNINATCNYQRVRFDLEYLNIDATTTLYHRTIIFPATINAFDFKVFIPDLTTTVISQTFLKPYDILGVYTVEANTLISVTKLMPTGAELMTSDYSDAEGKMTAYLIQGDSYIITIYADGVPARILGPYSADTDGTKILRLFDISAVSTSQDNTNTVTTQTFLSAVQGNEDNQSLMTMWYRDLANYTSSLTMTIYNNSCSNKGGIILTQTIPYNTLNSSTYNAFMTLNVYGSKIMNGTSNKVYCAYYNYTLFDGNTVISQKTITYDKFIYLPASFENPWTFQWIIMLLLLIIALGLNARTVSFGSLIIVALALGLYSWNWFATSAAPGANITITLAIALLIAIGVQVKKALSY